MTFIMSWAFTAGSNSQQVDTESSQALDLAYRFQGSVNTVVYVVRSGPLKMAPTQNTLRYVS